MKYLDAYAVLVHTDSLSAIQNNALSKFLVKIPGLEKKSYGDIDLYVLGEKSVALSDGAFLIRNDGWEHVGYDAKRLSTFAEIPHEAHLTLVNTGAIPIPIILSFVIPPESHRDLALRLGTTNEIIGRRVGGRMMYPLSLASGEMKISIQNKNTNKLIIQDPRLIYEHTRF